uniref:Uncharacterized protein n=1 Tax=Rhizophora mucronata TaxID=61149 RepID=A0A2P2PAC2_RHIMU
MKRERKGRGEGGERTAPFVKLRFNLFNLNFDYVSF